MFFFQTDFKYFTTFHTFIFLVLSFGKKGQVACIMKKAKILKFHPNLLIFVI